MKQLPLVKWDFRFTFILYWSFNNNKEHRTYISFFFLIRTKFKRKITLSIYFLKKCFYIIIIIVADQYFIEKKKKKKILYKEGISQEQMWKVKYLLVTQWSTVSSFSIKKLSYSSCSFGWLTPIYLALSRWTEGGNELELIKLLGLLYCLHFA